MVPMMNEQTTFIGGTQTETTNQPIGADWSLKPAHNLGWEDINGGSDE